MLAAIALLRHPSVVPRRLVVFEPGRLLGAGVVMALLAALMGLTDFLGESRIRALSVAWWHFLGNLLAVLLEAFNWYQRYTMGEGVVMLDTMRDKVFGPAETIEKMGVAPSQVRDYLALVGDSSDNVPGVPGIGVKTAAELIARFQVTASDRFFGFTEMTEETTVDITAYVLQVNGAMAGEAPLTRRTGAVVRTVTK